MEKGGNLNQQNKPKCKSISGRHKFSREIIFDRNGERTQKCIHCGTLRKAPKEKAA